MGDGALLEKGHTAWGIRLLRQPVFELSRSYNGIGVQERHRQLENISLIVEAFVRYLKDSIEYLATDLTKKKFLSD